MARQNKFKPNPAYKSFAEAREFAIALGLKSKQAWDDYTQGKCSGLPERPPDIPVRPAVFYRYEGWSGFPDFLGYSSGRKYRYFNDARNFVRSLQLSSIIEWRQYCQGEILNRGVKPADIPASPNMVYREWISCPDFLGNGMVEHNDKIYEPFEDARNFARSLHLKSVDQWFRYCNGEAFFNLPTRPENIPVFPYIVYKRHGWRSWLDFLGTAGAKHLMKIRDFESAREFVRELKFKNHKEWQSYCRGEMINRAPKPDDIPQSPDRVFKDCGWISWADYLGTDNISPWGYIARPFEQARAYVRKLGLKSEPQWRQYCKGELPGLPPKPDDIPTNPQRTYREEWQGMGDWLGTGNIANHRKAFRAFGQARQFVHRLKLKDINEWRLYCLGKIPGKGKRPDDIPTNPEKVYYYTGWLSCGDWLGTGSVHYGKIRRMSYEAARDFVRSIGIKTCTEWRKYVSGGMSHLPSKPSGIPSNLEQYFKGKWVSWKSSLGTEKPD